MDIIKSIIIVRYCIVFCYQLDWKVHFDNFIYGYICCWADIANYMLNLTKQKSRNKFNISQIWDRISPVWNDIKSILYFYISSNDKISCCRCWSVCFIILPIANRFYFRIHRLRTNVMYAITPIYRWFHALGFKRHKTNDSDAKKLTK